MSTPHATDLHETNPPTSTSAPLVSMPLHPVPMLRSPHNSPRVPGRPNHPSLPTIFIPRPLHCLTLLLTQIILDPPLLGDPLDGPRGPPQAMWVNLPVEGHPTVDPLGDGAQQWTTSPPSAETGTTTITTTMLDPCPELKIHRTIPVTHWPGRCLTMFQAKLITFQLESSRVAFAASYLQGIAFDHYTVLLRFDPNNSMLSNWLAFTQEFSSKFGIFDTVVEAEENLFNLRMRDNECFTTFIVWFEWEAYKTGWNYNALRFALRRTLPQQIKDVLCLTPKQTTYDRYKALVTQVNQRYWEDCSENTAPRTPWNASGNTNWQAGATNSIWSSIPTNPANPAPRFPLGQGITSTNPPQGQRPPAQLNATDLYETPEPLDTNPDNHNTIPDPANDQEALCTNRIRDSPWINVPEETQEKRQKEGTCILCGLEDTLDCGPDPDIFSALATLLHATILALDNPPVHLPSHSSTKLLLHTALPFTTNPVATLVDSGATDNFINESLAVLAPHPLRHLPAPIPLKLFDGDPTPAGDITHCLEMTMTFANG
ncbi:hypothetical protein E4T56_gene18535 [Termitomyces sp. T112]|nr:hypothetical protein E4T56_gene18535 [Termitomyces sp. T112]